MAQRRLGWLAIAFFAAGFVLAPALHLAQHDLPHDHEGGGLHYHFGSDGKPHGHQHQPFDPHHGDGSIAHATAHVTADGAAVADLGAIELVAGERIARARDAHEDLRTFRTLPVRGPPAAV